MNSWANSKCPRVIYARDLHPRIRSWPEDNGDLCSHLGPLRGRQGAKEDGEVFPPPQPTMADVEAGLVRLMCAPPDLVHLHALPYTDEDMWRPMLEKW